MKYYSNYKIIFESTNLENDENIISPEQRKINWHRLMNEIPQEDKQRIINKIDNHPNIEPDTPLGLKKLKIGAAAGVGLGLAGTVAANYFGHSTNPGLGVGGGGLAGLIAAAPMANKHYIKGENSMHAMLHNELKKLDNKKK